MRLVVVFGFDINQKKEPDGRVHLGVANTKKRLELICGGQMITTSEKAS